MFIKMKIALLKILYYLNTLLITYIIIYIQIIYYLYVAYDVCSRVLSTEVKSLTKKYILFTHIFNSIDIKYSICLDFELLIYVVLLLSYSHKYNLKHHKLKEFLYHQQITSQLYHKKIYVFNIELCNHIPTFNAVSS